MTNAPSDSAVAATALVRGFRRWYAVGVGGASDARNVAAAGGAAAASAES
jgi:hypothetical protein